MYYLDLEMVQEISERLILHWNYRGYSSFPDELCLCGNHVCELYLKYNNITRLVSIYSHAAKLFTVFLINFSHIILTQPDWIDTMTNLTNIYLQANYLTELPEAIQFLTSLKTLDVSQNYLSEIPSSIGKLGKLKSIILTHNKLTCLPDSLGNLSHLSSLLLSGNRLTQLPDSLHQCLHLEDIQMDLNNFTSLPSFLTRLPRLHRLSVCSNQLTHLPHLPFASIERFLCDNNPNLTYLPYPLACQMNRPPAMPLATRNVLHISCHGCFKHPSSSSTNRKIRANVLVKDSSDETSVALSFLPDIDLGSATAATPPSLVELTLRSISSRIFNEPLDTSFDRKNNVHRFELKYHLIYDRQIEEFCLPSTLIQLLRDGPVAICFACRTFIFRGPAYPVFLSKIIIENERANVQNLQSVVSSLLFCSASCFRTTITAAASSNAEPAAASVAAAGLQDRLDWECITHLTTSTN